MKGRKPVNPIDPSKLLSTSSSSVSSKHVDVFGSDFIFQQLLQKFSTKKLLNGQVQQQQQLGALKFCSFHLIQHNATRNNIQSSSSSTLLLCCPAHKFWSVVDIVAYGWGVLSGSSSSQKSGCSVVVLCILYKEGETRESSPGVS